MSSADDNMLATLSRIGAGAPEVIELFDYLEDTPMWMKDEAGHYEWANVAFLLNFGVKTRAEIIGRTDYDFCTEVLANQYRIDDERVLRGADLTPHAPAVHDEQGTLTYAELAGRARATADALIAAGARTGDRVAVHLPRGGDQVVAVVGAIVEGCV